MCIFTFNNGSTAENKYLRTKQLVGYSAAQKAAVVLPRWLFQVTQRKWHDIEVKVDKTDVHAAPVLFTTVH